jgi:DNA-binding transcriptional MocR family regulator
MDKSELKNLLQKEQKEYEAFKALGLSLDLSRGKPCTEQLNIGNALLATVTDVSDCYAENGFDCRNYGINDGLPEMKAIFADILEVPAKNIYIGGNASLNMMYDTLAHAMLYGVPGSERPWCKEDKISFICPAPGYDRHFAMLESLGIEMLTVKMNADGPDMDEVERLAISDKNIKGLICNPKYSNPTGITFSDEVVNRLAKMPTAAPDFRIIWDNAYVIHDLYPDRSDKLADILSLSAQAGNGDRVYIFTSTSKVTLPGAGVSAMATSENNLAQVKRIMNIETIGYDKLNQLRHVKYMKDIKTTRRIMSKMADIIRPKFEIVLTCLENRLGELGIAKWTEPKGGYFISLDVMPGCAKRVWKLMNEAGVALTNVGATFPYGNDPDDSNLRLAPTYASNEDLIKIMQVLPCCVIIAAAEKLLG